MTDRFLTLLFWMCKVINAPGSLMMTFLEFELYRNFPFMDSIKLRGC